MASSTALTAFSPSSANLHCIEINGSNLTVNNGEMFSRAQYFQIYGSSFNVYNDSSEVFYPWEALPATGPAEYWIIVCQSFGRPGESCHVARKFRTEEERDKFDLLLQRFVWSAFAMKSVRKVTVYGDPWLVVSSAALYTLQDMVQGHEKIPWYIRAHLYLKISTFFSNSSDVYPGQWSWQRLWKNDSSYKNLKLFDGNGNFIVDVELWESHGWLCHDYMEFQMNGDKIQNQKMKSYLNKIMISQGKVTVDQVVSKQLIVAKSDLLLLKNLIPFTAIPIPFFYQSLKNLIPFTAIPIPFFYQSDLDDPLSDDTEDQFHEILDSEITAESSDIEMDSLSNHPSFNYEPMDIDYSETEQSPEAMDVDSPVTVHSPGFSPPLALGPGFEYASLPCQVAM